MRPAPATRFDSGRGRAGTNGSLGKEKAVADEKDEHPILDPPPGH